MSNRADAHVLERIKRAYLVRCAWSGPGNCPGEDLFSEDSWVGISTNSTTRSLSPCSLSLSRCPGSGLCAPWMHSCSAGPLHDLAGSVSLCLVAFGTPFLVTGNGFLLLPPCFSQLPAVDAWNDLLNKDLPQYLRLVMVTNAGRWEFLSKASARLPRLTRARRSGPPGRGPRKKAHRPRGSVSGVIFPSADVLPTLGR